MIATADTLELAPLVLPDRVHAVLNPRVRVNSFDWLCENICDKKGNPFNPIDYPWTKGICDAYDDPEVREIVMQFAARVGKTMLGHGLFFCSLANDPADALFGTATEDLVKKRVRKEMEPMLEGCTPLRVQLLPKSKRLQTRIDLTTATIYCGWSGSPSTFADISVKYSHGSEISKWSYEASLEADVLELFTERGSEKPDRKMILESSPATTGKCRVNRKLHEGTNRRFHVPCPKCGTRQPLVICRGDPTEGGLFWDKDGEVHDPDLAAKTARYHCRSCPTEIHDEQKRPMVREGIWVAEGQRLTKTGRLMGQPIRGGPVESFQLSRLYSHLYSFGDVARKYSQGLLDEEIMRSVMNSWMGETWSPRRAVADWEDVAERLCMEYSMGTCPEGTSFVTTGIDHQMDHEVWISVAWSPSTDRKKFPKSPGPGYIVGYGMCATFTDLRSEAIEAEYPHADGGPPLWPEMTLFDTRFDEDNVLDFCTSTNRARRLVWPYMGAKAGTMKGKRYRRQDMTEFSRRSTRRQQRRYDDMFVVMGNSNYWETWLNHCLIRKQPGHNGSIAAPLEAREDEDFWEQVLNAIEVQKGETVAWVKLHENDPNDFRDALRYARIAAEVNVRSAWNRVRRRNPARAIQPPGKQREQPQRKPATSAAKPGGIRRPAATRAGRTGWIRRR